MVIKNVAMLYQTVKLLFSCYTIMLFIRAMDSWIPKLSQHKFMHFISHYTDPYLGIFKRIIPPIGGMLDISPMIGFFILQLLENIILSIIR